MKINNKKLVDRWNNLMNDIGCEYLAIGTTLSEVETKNSIMEQKKVSQLHGCLKKQNIGYLVTTKQGIADVMIDLRAKQNIKCGCLKLED